MNPFEELLESLGKMFHMKLHVDQSNACSIRLRGDLVVQLQLDEMQENLWIFSKLVEIPPGKFRENVMLEALKANALPDPRAGILAFIAQIHYLALFQKYPLPILRGEEFAGMFGAFVEMAEEWRGAISSGRSSPAVSKPLFGIR